LRREISTAQRVEAAQTAAQHLLHHPLFKQSEHIACYLPVKNEFDTQPLIEMIWQAGKHCYLPVLTEAKSLVFARYVKGDALVPNQFNIPEPSVAAERIAAVQLDLVVAPLVAFDAAGHRLGTGGGYYDRTFAFMQAQTQQKPVILGLAFALQQAKTLPSEAWDIQLNAILTEQSLALF
jgi:5-formyltetrahydrofolate cyclo-ligase